MNELPKRKRIRLPTFDYSQDSNYFVTICTHEKRKIFGMGDHLTDFGLLAENCLHRIAEIFPEVRADKYVVMPNHIHAIIVIEKADTPHGSPPALATIIGSYKAAVTREIHLIDPQVKVWQSRYYDHVVRDQRDYEAIWTYIDENPVKWESDEYY